MIVDSAETAMDCLGDVGPVGTCHTRWINSPTSNRFDPIEFENKVVWLLGLLFQFDRIDLPSISLAPNYKFLLGDSFFDQSHET